MAKIAKLLSSRGPTPLLSCPSFPEFMSYVDALGNEYRLHNESTRWIITETGFGMPPIEYLVSQGPFQHGQTPLDFRLRPRIIQLLHRRGFNGRDSYWDGRQSLINALRPNRQAPGEFATGRLRKYLPDGTSYDLNVLLADGPAFQARDPRTWDEWAYNEVLRFIAHDPIWFRSSQKTVTFVAGSTAFSQLSFPITFDAYNIVFGGASATALLVDTTITYPGTWLSYPVITIYGPLDNPVITNISTGERISSTYDIAAGASLAIDLTYGKKTVESSDGVNRIGTITTDSDLATFHIAPAPTVGSGNNVIRAEGTNAVAGTTRVTITYYERYIGI